MLPPLHTMKAYGEEGITPLILNHGSIWRVNGQIQGQAFSSGWRSPQYKLKRGWVGPWISLKILENITLRLFPNSPALSLVTTLTELAWCHTKGSMFRKLRDELKLM